MDNLIHTDIIQYAGANGIVFVSGFTSPEIESNQKIATEFLAIRTGEVSCYYLFCI